MYGYGNSGNIWGAVIGIIIGLIVIFLICRELMCWYFKINKLVSLMEDQNMLLKRLLNQGDSPINNVSSETNVNNSVKDNKNGEYITANLVQLRDGPGEEFTYIGKFEANETVTRTQVKGDWSFVSKDNLSGWCMSSCLKNG